MTKPEDIDALIERVKGLSGPDREVDAQLVRIDPGPRPFITPALYTDSIDAALALVERVLPGQWLEMINRAFELMWVEYAPKAPLEHLPRFIILALLTAIRNQEHSHDKA